MSTSTMFTPTEPGTTFSSRIGGLARARETGILLALLLVIAVTTIKNPAFLFSSDGFRDLLLTPSILVVVAIGEAMVIITRNVDLSVGSILGLSAYLTGRLFIDFPGIPITRRLCHRHHLRSPARSDQRCPRSLGQGSLPRDHPRYAVHLPRHQPGMDRK